MPKVATTFGRVLGPAGKMPSPQLGILTNVSDKEISAIKKKISGGVKISTAVPDFTCVAIRRVYPVKR